MKKEINLSEVFLYSKSVSDLLKSLEEYKNDGVVYVKSYGLQGIEIQKLINRIELLKNETLDLDEIGKGIMSYINS